jgi:hypothetical protein
MTKASDLFNTKNNSKVSSYYNQVNLETEVTVFNMNFKELENIRNNIQQIDTSVTQLNRIDTVKIFDLTNPEPYFMLGLSLFIQAFMVDDINMKNIYLSFGGLFISIAFILISLRMKNYKNDNLELDSIKRDLHSNAKCAIQSINSVQSSIVRNTTTKP